MQLEQRTLQPGKAARGRAWRKPGVPSPLLLDRGTNSVSFRQKPELHRVLTVRDYSKVGIIEFGWSKYQPGKSVKDSTKEPDKEENKKRALSRARANVRRDCLEMGAAYILTLTYHANMLDRATTLYHRQQFDRRMRSIYGERWRFLAVPERQKRGAWHWHIVTPFQVDQAIALREWRAVTGDPTITQVDAGFKPNGKGNAYSKCAGYVAKYVGKDLDGEKSAGQHRYHVTRGLKVHPERFEVRPGAPKDTESKMICDLIAFYFPKLDFVAWTAPMPAGSPFGFMRVERNQLQPEEREE